MRRDSADAGNIGQVDTRDPEQLSFEVESRLVVSFLVKALLCTGWHLVRRPFCTWDLSHRGFKFLVDLTDKLLIEAKSNKRLPESEQVFCPVISFEGFGDPFAWTSDRTVAKRCQFHRISLAVKDCIQYSHPAQSSDVARNCQNSGL